MPASLPRPDDDPPGAWRRNPYVLMLIAIPLSVVLMASVMIPLAIQSHDGEVIDDYYRRGLLIDRELERDQTARRLGLSATATLAAAPPTLTVALHPTSAGSPAEITVRLMHATRGDGDAVLTARRGRGGRYRIAIPALAPGHWYLRVEQPTWRLSGEFVHPGARAVTLR